MLNEESDLFLSHVEPVLAVKDVTETVEYWHKVLGFPNKWTWGEPPNHGGVAWQGVFVQFSQQPSLASVSHPWIHNSHPIGVRLERELSSARGAQGDLDVG